MDSAIFEEFYQKIYNYIYYRVLNRADAEDITSEVFIRAAANAASYDSSRASYATWLFAIANNCVMKFYRDRKATVSFEDFTSNQEIPESAAALDEALIAEEDARQLYRLLKTLSERERILLALRYWGGLSYKEIAAQTGLSEKNVSVVLSRTIAKLKRKWKN